ITAKGQLVGMSVERAVATFHRLDAECVADPKRPDRNGPEERTEVVAETEIETETLALGGEVVERMVFEVACQVDLVVATARATRVIVTLQGIRADNGYRGPGL